MRLRKKKTHMDVGIALKHKTVRDESAHSKITFHETIDGAARNNIPPPPSAIVSAALYNTPPF